MRHVRTSTWILIAVFLVALVTYLLFRPSHATSTGRTPASSVAETCRPLEPSAPVWPKRTRPNWHPFS